MIERCPLCEADAVAGFSLAEIAARRKLSKTSVHRRLALAGVKIQRRRGTGGPHNRLKRSRGVENDRERGLSLSQIASKRKLSKQGVLRRLALAPQAT